jgi:chromosome partitioning protein
MMRTLAFLTQKGGSGKTTLALHIAVAALEDRARVLLVDTDPQQSAAAWRGARQAVEPMLLTVPAERIGEVQDAARRWHGLVVIDSAPHAGADSTRLARAADFVVIPLRPDTIDVAAVGAAMAIVQAVQVPAVFVLSSCPPRAPEIEETRAALGAYDYPVAPCIITERRGFARAFATGRAVTEFEADGKAAAEIRALWRYLKENMDGKASGRKSK